ncbi:hypothetical protein P154DRAFT_70477 [Amniculicola lignicola CBS 123094]|uniref:SnoaL-like domain-containing protein n=1 Tax=Amniculicola lignicola CBS 123094 TaxID=1392246 RepID=A0A6A5VXR5_9PLEO|nr:hypothetical protein P154DRAFT_70477 [Amniculicola lignicola CBS 123094]
MRFTILSSVVLVPLGALGAPTPLSETTVEARQARPAKPKPCQPLVPAPTEEETLARHYKFANAFIVAKNITEAFTYISQGYVNHNPAAQNGFDSAWNILSPIWGSQNITPLKTAFKSPQGWLNYQSGSFGTIVDRFRWEGGCIAEHWDQGEKFPTNVNSTACSRTTCGGT